MLASPRALFVALVDLSAPAGGGDGRAAALDRARLFLDTLFDGLAGCAADGQLPCEFDVAAVGCRRSGDAAEVVPLLPGTVRAAVPLAGLLAADRPRRGEGEPRRWLADATPGGEPAADAGWVAAHRVVSRWLSDNPAARPPVVVYCAFAPVDPEGQSAAERGVRALGRPLAPTVVFTHRPPDNDTADLPVAAVWELLFADHPPRVAVAEPTPEAPPFEVVREFHCEKLGNDPAQWEDGYATDPNAGRAAIADGASEGIYCRVWADLLSAGVVADAPDPTRLGLWVSDRRAEWRRRIDYPKLNWSKQAKVDSTGAAATLLGLSVGPLTPAGGRVWRAMAVGDACLFWVRDGRLMLSFPLACGEQLGSAPDLLRTLTGRREPNPLTAGGVCRPGDLFLLATDAVAGHLFRLAEGGQPLARYADLSAEEWRQEATGLRRNGGMVNDDCTLLVLRVTGSTAEPPPAEAASAEADTAEPVVATDPPAAAADGDDHAYSGA